MLIYTSCESTMQRKLVHEIVVIAILCCCLVRTWDIDGECNPTSCKRFICKKAEGCSYRTCTGKKSTVGCPKGKLMKVHDAWWGRVSTEICVLDTGSDIDDCNPNATLRNMQVLNAKRFCDNETLCTLTASYNFADACGKHNWGDPCPNKGKYLILNYTCFDGPAHKYWPLWSEWTDCSSSCGGGRRTREKNCTENPHSDKCSPLTCKAKFGKLGSVKKLGGIYTQKQEEKCNEQPCPDPLPTTSSIMTASLATSSTPVPTPSRSSSNILTSLNSVVVSHSSTSSVALLSSYRNKEISTELLKAASSLSSWFSAMETVPVTSTQQVFSSVGAKALKTSMEMLPTLSLSHSITEDSSFSLRIEATGTLAPSVMNSIKSVSTFLSVYKSPDLTLPSSTKLRTGESSSSIPSALSSYSILIAKNITASTVPVVETPVLPILPSHTSVVYSTFNVVQISTQLSSTRSILEAFSTSREPAVVTESVLSSGRAKLSNTTLSKSSTVRTSSTRKSLMSLRTSSSSFASISTSIVVVPPVTTEPPKPKPNFHGNITFIVSWREFCQELKEPFIKALQKMLRDHYLRDFDVNRFIIMNEENCKKNPDGQAVVRFFVKTNGKADEELTQFLVKELERLTREGGTGVLGEDFKGKIIKVVLVRENVGGEKEKWPLWLVVLIAMACAIFVLWLLCCIWICCCRKKKLEGKERKNTFRFIDPMGIPHARLEGVTNPRYEDNEPPPTYTSSINITPSSSKHTINDSYEMQEMSQSTMKFRPITMNLIVTPDHSDAEYNPSDDEDDPEPFKKLDPLGIPRAKLVDSPSLDAKAPLGLLPRKDDDQSSLSSSSNDESDGDDSDDFIKKEPNIGTKGGFSPIQLKIQFPDEEKEKDKPNNPSSEEDGLQPPTSETDSGRASPAGTTFTRVYFNGRLLHEIPTEVEDV